MIAGFGWLHHTLLSVGTLLACLCVDPLINHWHAWRAERKDEDGQR